MKKTLWQLFTVLALFIGTDLGIHLLTGASAWAASARLRIPVVIDYSPRKISAKQINRKIEKVNGTTYLPLYVEVSSKKDAMRKLDQLARIVPKAVGALGADYAAEGPSIESYPGENNLPGARTCYLGNPSETVALIASLADIFYSDQLVIRNWGVKKGVIWIRSSVTDDGNDIQRSTIPRCVTR